MRDPDYEAAAADVSEMDEILRAVREKVKARRNIMHRRYATVNRIIGPHREDAERNHQPVLDAIAVVKKLEFDPATHRVEAEFQVDDHFSLVLNSTHPAVPFELDLYQNAGLLGKKVHIVGVPKELHHGVIVLSRVDLVSDETIDHPAVSLDVLEWQGRTAHFGLMSVEDMPEDVVGASILQISAHDGGHGFVFS